MNAPRWSYEVVTMKPGLLKPGLDPEKLKQTLNEMGQKGWELVGLSPYLGPFANTSLLFKRQI